jgi:hypothetical protein
MEVAESIANLMRNHRERLRAERKAIVRRQEELKARLSQVDSDIEVVNRHITAISRRKAPPPKLSGERYTGVREDVYRILVQRKLATAVEIQEFLGFSNSDRRATQSVRNALAALKKEGSVFITERGVYQIE